MTEFVFVPSPNSYAGKILACSDDGAVVAFGAKHEIVLFRPTSSAGGFLDLQTSLIPSAHGDRIVAVAFGPSQVGAYRTHVATASDDGSVRLWDHSTESLILKHSGHGDDEKVVSLDWSIADANMIVSVSDVGSIVVWDLEANKRSRFSLPADAYPLTVDCCPHDRDIVAVGCESGLVVVYNTRDLGSVVHRLSAHETDVVSLSWCPAPHNVLGDEARNDMRAYLLASGAQDRSVHVWRAGSDGRRELTIDLPHEQLTTDGNRSKADSVTHWTCVKWTEPLKLLTSSMFGELLEYDLDRPHSAGKLTPPRLVHGRHWKNLFSIAIPTHSPDKPFVWTWSLDRQIVACHLGTSAIVRMITTFRGAVYCIASSPLDPSFIAIGTYDCKILVWNMTKNVVVPFWNNSYARVKSIAWHPSDVSVLAFGTFDGCIGLLDISKPTTLPKLLPKRHKKSVYTLVWAPPIVEFSDQQIIFALFSVGDGEIIQHNPDMPEKEPIKLSSYLKRCDESTKANPVPNRSGLAWNHDYSLAAIANASGVLYIVKGRTFEHLHTSRAHKKLIQCVVWHPATVTSKTGLSPYNTWLASAGENVCVMNVTSSGVDIIASLNSHTEKIACVAWSPHINGLMITASNDRTSLVWDVVSTAVLARFNAHHGSVLCALPSPCHQDFVITGSVDSTVRVWDSKKFQLSEAGAQETSLSKAVEKCTETSRAPEQLSV